MTNDSNYRSPPTSYRMLEKEAVPVSVVERSLECWNAFVACFRLELDPADAEERHDKCALRAAQRLASAFDIPNMGFGVGRGRDYPNDSIMLRGFEERFVVIAVRGVSNFEERRYRTLLAPRHVKWAGWSRLSTEQRSRMWAAVVDESSR